MAIKHVFLLSFVLGFSISAQAAVNYFGYYASAMNGVGSGDYINDVSGISNTVFIRGDTTAEVIQKLQEAQAHKMSAVVMVQNVMFPWASSQIYPDFLKRFQDFHSAIQGYDYMIAAYYIFDEPYLNNQHSDWKSVPATTLFNNLTSAIQAVNQTAPGKPTAIFFSGPEVTPSLMIPSNLSWFGFDCYVADPSCTDSAVIQKFNIMLSLRHSSQHIITAIDGYWPSSPSSENSGAVIARIQLWESLISAHLNEVIAVFPFLYQTDTTQSLYGAQSMPDVLGWLNVYFSALKGDVVCDANDLVRLQNGAVIDRWANAPMCVPRCVGENYVRFNATGAPIDTWTNAPNCH